MHRGPPEPDAGYTDAADGDDIDALSIPVVTYSGDGFTTTTSFAFTNRKQC